MANKALKRLNKRLNEQNKLTRRGLEIAHQYGLNTNRKSLRSTVRDAADRVIANKTTIEEELQGKQVIMKMPKTIEELDLFMRGR